MASTELKFSDVFWKLRYKFKIGSYKRKVEIEISTVKLNQSELRFTIDGSDKELIFRIALIFHFRIVLRRLWLSFLYPYRISSYDRVTRLGEPRTIGFYLYNGSFIWQCWVNDEYYNLPKYRYWYFHSRDFFVPLIVGTYEDELRESEQFNYLLPCYEGNYNVVITRNYYKRKYKRKIFKFLNEDFHSYQANFGFINDENEFISIPFYRNSSNNIKNMYLGIHSSIELAIDRLLSCTISDRIYENHGNKDKVVPDTFKINKKTLIEKWK